MTPEDEAPVVRRKILVDDRLGWAAWSPDGSRLAYGHEGGSIVHVQDLRTGQALDSIECSGRVYDGAWSPDGKQLCVAESGGDVIYNWPARTVATKFYGSNISIAWSPTGNQVAVDGASNVRIVNAETGEEQLRHEMPQLIYRVRWSRDLLVAADKSGVTVVRPGLPKKRHSFKSELPPFVTVSTDGTLAVNDGAEIVIIGRGKEIRIQHHTTTVLGLAFSHDGKVLLSLVDGALAAWDTRTWSLLHTWVIDAMGIVSSPTEPLIACLTRGSIWILEIAAGGEPLRKSVYYTTAKIALVGDSGVGKTGLGWVLTHDQFKEHASTHGEQFWLAERLSMMRADGTQCEAVVWDLAGQPDYRLIHSLFIDDADVALVVIDSTNRQEPLKGAEFWLRALRAQRDNRCRTILVGARIDRGTGILTDAELETFARSHGVAGGYIATSARTGEGVEALVSRITALIDWDKRQATVTLDTFKEIKGHVLEIKETDAAKDVLVTLKQLQRRLTKRTGTTYKLADIATATKHLADHGYTRYLRNSKGQPFVLLSPDLLNNLAASMILETRRNPRGLGALDEHRVLRGDYQFAELASLDPQDREILLDAATTLFIDHNVCFRETFENEILLIFPSLINQNKPPTEDLPVIDGTAYTATGATENVYASLVVLLGYTNTFTRMNQWRNQAQYEMGPGQICGFRLTEEREGEIDFVLYFAASASTSTKQLFQGLFEKFLLARDVKVEIFPPVQCPQCTYVQPRSEVIKRQREQALKIFCSNCGAKVELPRAALPELSRATASDTLERERRTAAKRTRFEKAVTWLKSYLRDTRTDPRPPSCFISYARGDSDQERWVERTLATDLRNAGVAVILDTWHNRPGASISHFIERIETADFVTLVGTTALLKKYESKDSDPVSAAEIKLINMRLRKREAESSRVIPILLDGGIETSLPPLAKDSVIVDLRQDDVYFENLFDLLLTLFDIPFDDPAMRDLRDTIRTAGPRERT